MNRESLLKIFFCLGAVLVFVSCRQKLQHQNDVAVKKNTPLPPVTYIVKSPTVVLLDTCPPPQIINVPQKPGGSYTVNTENGPKTIPLLPPVTRAASFFVTMQHYNVEDGLALSNVPGSLCDKNGNLWFGTSAGVSRYDGKSFRNYGINQGLGNNSVFCICQDKNGLIWFGTWGGVSVYDGKIFREYDTSTGLAGNKVNAIVKDQNGYLWIGTNNGLSRYDGKLFKNYTTTDGLAGPNIYGLAVDKKGNIWVGTTTGVSCYDGKSFKNFTTKSGLLNNNVYCLLADSQGSIWVGTTSGISVYDGKSFKNITIAQGLVGNEIQCMMEDDDHHIWIGTSAGASEYDGKAFRNYTVANGLPGSQVLSVVEDKNHDIWFGTQEDGVARYTGRAFTSFTKNQGLSSNEIIGITQDRNGSLWFGTQEGGALNYDGKSFTGYTTEQGLSDNTVLDIYQSRNGTIWFATWRGVSCFNGRAFTQYTVAQGLASNTVWSITEDEKGNMWFGCFGGGVSKLAADKKSIVSYTSPDTLTNNNVHQIRVTGDGMLWIGNDYGGVTSYEGNVFKNYSTSQGLVNPGVIGVLVDKHHCIWIASTAGISRFDGKTFMNLTTAQGLASELVTSITEDRNGTIWAGSHLGFFGLTFKQKNTGTGIIPGDNNLNNAQLAKQYKPVFEDFNFENGYPVRGLAYSNTIYIDKTNILWAGTGDKLVRFDHSGIHKNATQPALFIQNIKLNNEAVCWYDLTKTTGKIDTGTMASNTAEENTLYGKRFTRLQRDSVYKKFSDVRFDSISRFYDVPVNLTLPYRYNNITFEFAAIEPSRPKLVRYRYKLDGYDNDWSAITDQSIASFGNIHEGSYVFKLKAQSPDGVWSRQVVYAFTILPPWYRAWWAYVVYIAAFLFALWAFIRWRIAALRKEKVLLEERITERTHQLKEEKEKVESTLRELKATQTQLIQSEKMASLGELTAGIAHEIQNPLNFVNNFSEVSVELVNEMEQELDKGDTAEAKAIANDVKENLEKIRHHGRRADAIVKGMLQHSKSGSGSKEPTNISSLADEYMRLAYHGLRSKDKLFNAEMVTHFDPDLPRISVIPQDIGRVMLNLFNNAFYAVNQKQKAGGLDYRPEVAVTTSLENGQVIIKVKDNGAGIPDAIKEKIMQPFFTTKPTGEGTGLGLSLTYDMVVKGHGGTIKVDSEEGEGAEFVILLPVS